MGLDGTDGLAAVIRRHPQVERIVCGHLHRSIVRRFAGTVACTSPATAHQLALDLGPEPRLATVMEPPACLLHLWMGADGARQPPERDRRPPPPVHGLRRTRVAARPRAARRLSPITLLHPREPMTKITQSVDLDRRGHVAVLTVDNPPVNALSQHVRQGLHEASCRRAADAAVQAVVIACAGPHVHRRRRHHRVRQAAAGARRCTPCST